MNLIWYEVGGVSLAINELVFIWSYIGNNGRYYGTHITHFDRKQLLVCVVLDTLYNGDISLYVLFQSIW